MIFKRSAVPGQDFFFLPQPANSAGVLIFTRFAPDIFDLAKAIQGAITNPYLLIFYQGAIDNTAITLDELQTQLAIGTTFLWVDQFAGLKISAQNSISIAQYNQVAVQQIGVNIGNNIISPFSLTNLNSKGQVAYDASKYQLTVNAVSGTFEVYLQGGEALAAAFTIPLTADSADVAGHTFQQKNNLGAVCLQMQQRGTKTLPQPKSPMLMPVSPGKHKPVFFGYFDEQDYTASVTNYLAVKPFNTVHPGAGPQSSYLESVGRAGLKTCFVDEQANKYSTSSMGTNNTLVSRLVPVASAAGLSSTDYFFIPQDGQPLKLTKNQLTKYCLIGNSGTEALDLLEFVFLEEDNLLINPDGGDDLYQAEYILPNDIAPSKTSFLQIAAGNYHLDSYQSPIFPNTGAQSDYHMIPKAKITQPVSLPIIPTLAFNGNNDLLDAEAVIRKARLKRVLHAPATVNQAASGTYVTPQGFLKKGSDYDFIPNMNPLTGTRHLKKVRTARTAPPFFQFTITDNGHELDLSLRKDEVFLVLTPLLFSKYIQTVPDASVSVTFSANKSVDIQFIADLTGSYKGAGPGTNTHGQSIIIIKFFKDSVGNLINQPAKWSNHGSVLGNKQTIADMTAAFKTATANVTDDYFVNSVLKDPNWNGICVLNIPISSPGSLPTLFTGLGANQNLFGPNSNPDAKTLQTQLAFQYVAFPINKTVIDGALVKIASTSFFGYIDYSPFTNDSDYGQVSAFFDNSKVKFILSKLQVQFRNSNITQFISYAFLQVPQLFDDHIDLGMVTLANPGERPVRTTQKPNLLLINGSYQKNTDGSDNLQFYFSGDVTINFNGSSILDKLLVCKVGFVMNGGGATGFRFEIDATVKFKAAVAAVGNIFSFDDLKFHNIGLAFSLNIGNFIPKFDLSRLLVLPSINFNGSGFLSSFPIRFNGFRCFRFTGDGAGGFTFPDLDFDFLKLPHFSLPSISLGSFGNLFSFIFDIDLGTLGPLGGAQGLKAQLMVGWSFQGGFGMGLKINGPSLDRLHIDLFGALKLDVEQLALCQMGSQFMIKIIDARLTIFGLELPKSADKVSAIIFAKPGQKTAWLASYLSGTDLALGIGQRVALSDLNKINDVADAVQTVKKLFVPQTTPCPATFPAAYSADSDWLIASEKLLENWPVDLSFIFNDPRLYGIHLGVAGFVFDILYKKLSDNLGVYAADIQLPDSLRNHDTGGAYFRLPNLGIQIFTNGGWKVDLGFPASSNDWSRSGFLQLRTVPPFVGWFGFYLGMARSSVATLFEGIDMTGMNILQFGMGMRVGLGAYIDGGIFYAGASISVYGILEGAAAFKKAGIATYFPQHFAVQGRVGAIAEIVGYVDFGILKAGVYISLSAEFGFLLIYLGEAVGTRSAGIQPVKVYIEGDVSVQIRIKIGCIHIHLSFGAHVRFEYVIGGGGSQHRQLSLRELLHKRQFHLQADTHPVIPIPSVKDIPVIYMPAFTVGGEFGSGVQLIHKFMIPFFGNGGSTATKVTFSATNILKNSIIKPFFQDLLSVAGPSTYEDLKLLLNKADFQVPHYRLMMIQGLNGVNVDDFLTKPQYGFGFQIGELQHGGAVNNIQSNYADMMLLIPAPATAALQIVDDHYDGTNPVFQTAGGFDITLTALVNKPDGTGPLTTHIGPISDYTQADVDWMTQTFNDYKTQFDDQQNASAEAKRKQLQAGNPDFRQTVAIPEFFTLVALLTLERLYHNPAIKRTKTGQLPKVVLQSVDSTGIFNYTADGTLLTWNPKDDLQDIAGQLNYFYNSGLRLPSKANNNSSLALMDLLKQRQEISVPDPATRTAAAVTVTIGGQNMTPELFATQADIKVMWKYLDGFQPAVFDLSKLKNEFIIPVGAPSAISIAKPYNLVPVRLSVPNSKLNFNYGPAGTVARFFDVPAKLRAEGAGGTHFAFALNCADHEQDKIAYATNPGAGASPLSGFSVSLNIEIKVRTRSTKALNTLEITGVEVADLNLIRLLHEEQFRIDTAALYFKPAVDSAAIQLLNLSQQPFAVVKTNLSTRTSPPIIEFAARTRAAAPEPVYWASSGDADLINLVELTWEGLTTNSGGYFLVLGQPIAAGSELADTTTVHTLILSLGSKKAAVPSYFNYFALDTGSIGPLLDKNTHYLFLDQLTAGGKAVQEYHPSIPVHTVSFSLNRDTSRTVTGTVPYSESNYNKYYPLEFAVTATAGGFSLSSDQVLPVLPSSSATAASILNYQHVSPLLQIKDSANLDRYKPIGQQFRIDTALRDIFGIRAGTRPDAIATTNYQHAYNDKLIPADAWPLCRFGFWVNTQVSGNPAFNLTQTVDLLSVQDLAGIPRQTADYTYGYGKLIDPDDVVRLQTLLHNGLNDKLNNILAQLSDGHCTVTVHNYSNEAAHPAKGQLFAQVKGIQDQLTYMVTERTISGVKGYYMPVKPMANLNFPLQWPALAASAIKAKLDVSITFSRPAALLLDQVYAELRDPAIWEYRTTATLVNNIAPATWADPKLQTQRGPRNAAPRLTASDAAANLRLMNTALEAQTTQQYTLGLSSDKQTNAKTIYLINKKAISGIKVKPKYCTAGTGGQPPVLNPAPCYFGIKPFSNQLWSGTYQPASGAEQVFTDVDLDSALKLVLGRMEALAQPDLLSVNFPVAPGLYQQLMAAKKRLVNNRLRSSITWAADPVNKPLPDTGMISEFNDLLLRDLNNFYAFDGVVAAGVDTGALDLSGHRLTLALAQQKGYNLVSSKLGYHYLDGGTPVANQNWYVLFDQLANSGTISFDLTPAVTHIECDLVDDPVSQIASATWIQLIEPFGLAQPSYRVAGWDLITRSFPPKPVILKHVATQAKLSWPNWDIHKAGLWNYELQIDDKYTYSGDALMVEIELATLPASKRLLADSDPSAFIAYWAALIADPDPAKFKWQDFVSDLSSQVPAAYPLRSVRAAAAGLPSFSISTDGAGHWSLNGTPNGLPAVTVGAGAYVKIGTFDIFQTNARVLSVMPRICALRNSKIPNPDFLYQTAVVQPLTPAVPHISYPDPVGLPQASTFQNALFQYLSQMPFRATARYWVKPGTVIPGPGERLPVIPVKQFECPSGNNITDPDNSVFDKFQNGFAAYTLIVYNHEGSADADLPVLYANAIIKP